MFRPLRDVQTGSKLQLDVSMLAIVFLHDVQNIFGAQSKSGLIRWAMGDKTIPFYGVETSIIRATCLVGRAGEEFNQVGKCKRVGSDLVHVE